nr:hypothetical protein [Pandoraea captiosa]
MVHGQHGDIRLINHVDDLVVFVDREVSRSRDVAFATESRERLQPVDRRLEQLVHAFRSPDILFRNISQYPFSFACRFDGPRDPSKVHDKCLASSEQGVALRFGGVCSKHTSGGDICQSTHHFCADDARIVNIRVGTGIGGDGGVDMNKVNLR